MNKSELRQRMLQQRSALSEGEQRRLGEAAQTALIASYLFERAGTVLLYQAFRGEVPTDRIVRAAVAAGKRLALPRVVRNPRGLVLHAYGGDPATLARGAYDIAEPHADWPVLAPGEIDLAVVPGVAFDPTGNRLGYGGGYYDRLLPGLTRAALVGLAYSFQLVPSLPADPHDIPLHALATDRGLVEA
jgi:5-formyltetrahydrofolate cyclo-ligase